MTDMKYDGRPDGPTDSYWDMFFPWTTFLDIVVTGLAIFGFGASVLRRHLAGAWLGICCLALTAFVFLANDSLPVIGLLWNPRLLPFLYLLRLMLMMVGIVELVEVVVRGFRTRRCPRQHVEGRRSRPRPWSAWWCWSWSCSSSSRCRAVARSHEARQDRVLLGHRWLQPHHLVAGRRRTRRATAGRATTSWATRAADAYGEYKALVDQMETLGADPSIGCGRAMWENNGDNGQYGTTMALMLLPHWTDGCIASMEGLFFEACGTTPYHFLTAAAMSSNSSNPVRELRYDDNDAAKGVPYMQTLGRQVPDGLHRGGQDAGRRPGRN